MSRPTYLTIDLAALKANMQRIRELAPKTQVIAMVKANAYGHGIQRVASALPDADAFGVASLEEGVVLREAGIHQPIILMEGVFSAEELIEAARQSFTLVVHHDEHVNWLEQVAAKQNFPIWLKINTGMNRLGVAPENVANIYSRLKHLAKPLGLMTHFASADILASEMTTKQMQTFHAVTAELSGPRSLANSAGILGWPNAHADWVRPGLILYGASPFVDKTGLDYGLQPVMTFSSQLIAVISVKAGESVGYGGTWTAKQATKIGVVGVGYGDGYPKNAEAGTPVLVNHRECPLVGRVSMDMLTVDLGVNSQDKIGDAVTLWGVGLPVERVAKKCLTSAWEILTRMTPRPKILVK